MQQKIMVAMSGGVDSAAAALLIKEAGHSLCGVTLKLYHSTDSGCNTCCSLRDIEDARAVAFALGFRHYVFHFQELFSQKVIQKFVNSYLAGSTPNPCIDCNRYIKFDALLTRAQALEQDYVATGHYARIEKTSDRFLLKKGVDLSKDQSYVLYSLTQKQLSKTLFPLGGYYKTEIREIAEKMKLRNAKKPDSQDICFVRHGNYAAFIEDYTKTPMVPGDFVDQNGIVLGRHKGLPHYTIGQRKGLGLSFGKPMYVTQLDAENNRVVLAEEVALFSKTLHAGALNWIAIEALTTPIKVEAKIRYRQDAQPAWLFPLDDGQCLVEFETPQRAITKGQAAVFYQGDVVIGGGVIQ